MIGDWAIRHLPRCTHHVFLSHCAEDRDRLALPVYESLEKAKFIPWLDKHHYPAGQGVFEALREGILHCRHLISLVTTRFLTQGRGWNSVENAYANLLQDNLHFQSLELCHIQFPLLFLPHNHAILQRSAWGPLVHRGRRYPPERADRAAAAWATQEIAVFIRQEERRGASLAEQIQNDPGFQPLLKAEPNLLLRIMCADPPSLP